MTQTPSPSVPLYVDLDGTLIATDLLWESVMGLVRIQPADALRIPIWLLKGKANLKHQLARRVPLGVAHLPYRPEVLAFLTEQRAAGRRLVLATASPEAYARAVADHLGLFDDVLASSEYDNLKGAAKREKIVSHCGGDGYAYIGDSVADRPLWQGASEPIVVGTERTARRLYREGTCRVITHPAVKVRDVVRGLRPHQWAKNSLLALPLLASHRFLEVHLLALLFFAVLAFSLLASCVYVVNDLLDLQQDRRHASKKSRPFASGAISIPIGIGVAVGLFAGALGLVFFLPARFGLLLALYFICTTAYSLHLKKKLLVDVICLAGLYTIRVLAGGEAVGIAVSDWLLAFSMFLFLSLALAKRYTELTRSKAQPNASGRGYRVEDMDLVRSMGVSSGLLAVLVFCLYIHSGIDATRLYTQPRLLWLICPVMLYWIARVWFLASRGELNDDPVVFALRDRISQMSAIVVVIVLIGASLWRV